MNNHTDTKSGLTQKQLKRVLHYDPDTGIFTWLKTTSNHYKGEAGCYTYADYRSIWIKTRPYMTHRLAWLYVYGKFPSGEIDHINHNRADNRIVNLRDIPRVANQRNQKLHTNNTSGVVGVCWKKKEQKWTAQIVVNRKCIYLGLFKYKKDAIKARKEAEIIHNFHPNHGK